MSDRKSPSEIAQASLRANVIQLPTGKFVAAGQNQFRTLWTRDFCHASRGFFTMNETEVVRDHLSRLLQSVREDGLVPRVLDNKIVQWRVAYQVVRRIFPFLPAFALREPLRPQYTDEHGSNAIDSNLLVLLTALRLREFEGGEAWWKANEKELKRVWHWYDSRLKDGFIYQTPFADWQDTVKREGIGFLTNLFYLLCAYRLEKLGWSTGVNTADFSKRLKGTFYNPQSGVFRSLLGSVAESVDGNLIAIEAPEFLDDLEKKKLWQSLLAHPLATQDGGMLGRCSHPKWPRQDIAWHALFVGLKRYHDGLAWSWLVGLGLKVAHMQGDTEYVTRARARIHQYLLRDGEVVELYDTKREWRAWSSWLLQAEHPFSWGAGYLIEALHLTDKTS